MWIREVAHRAPAPTPRHHRETDRQTDRRLDAGYGHYVTQYTTVPHSIAAIRAEANVRLMSSQWRLSDDMTDQAAQEN